MDPRTLAEMRMKIWRSVSRKLYKLEYKVNSFLSNYRVLEFF